MKVCKVETKYYVKTDGKDDYGMDVGATYKFDCEEDMFKFLDGEYVESIGCSMNYYEYPIEVYSRTEYGLLSEDE